MKVIALKGISNVGKSETIKKTYELLKTKYPDHTILFQEIYKVDITIILNINGKQIGIESQGDPNGNLIKGSLNRFVAEGCHVIICATRTYGRTVDAVNALQQQRYAVVWLGHVDTPPDQREARNLATANTIINETEEIINA